MRNFVTSALVAGLVVASMCAGPINRTVAAATENQAVLRTDHYFTGALAKGDKKAVGALLDSRFEWTNAEGKTRSKAEALESLTAFAADSKGDTDVKAHFYSQLAVIYGRHDRSWFSRIWVKRPSGWRLFADLDTPLPSGNGTAARRKKPGPIGDCENPCRTIPYKPTTAADKAVIAEWQKTKVDEWHPDIKDWASHVAREFVIINDHYGAIDKPQRVALGVKWQREGIGMPGAPVLSMKMYDFGDTVLTISDHVPYQGGKPYYNVRVYVHRNGHWPIAWSQQTTIQSAAPLPAVSAAK
jgi:Domain of unknown function (DUF4440)